MIVIDPPTPFDPLSEWTRFRKAMEKLVKDHPDDPNVIASLEQARNEEARLSA